MSLAEFRQIKLGQMSPDNDCAKVVLLYTHKENTLTGRPVAKANVLRCVKRGTEEHVPLYAALPATVAVEKTSFFCLAFCIRVNKHWRSLCCSCVYRPLNICLLLFAGVPELARVFVFF